MCYKDVWVEGKQIFKNKHKSHWIHLGHWKKTGGKNIFSNTQNPVEYQNRSVLSSKIDFSYVFNLHKSQSSTFFDLKSVSLWFTLPYTFFPQNLEKKKEDDNF